jgi:hypothetical protein
MGEFCASYMLVQWISGLRWPEKWGTVKHAHCRGDQDVAG